MALQNPFVAQNYKEGKIPVLDVRGAMTWAGSSWWRCNCSCGRVSPNGCSTIGRVPYTGQLLKGERYELVLPNYIICFVNETVFPDNAYHHSFRCVRPGRTR